MKKTKLFLVEDHELVRKGVRSIIDLDQSIDIIGEYDRASKAIEAIDQGNVPDIILMDISMPEMNGLEATHAIRDLENEPNWKVPIIGVTAHALKGDRERCLEAGMNDYLSKPVSPDALQEKVQYWLEERGNLKLRN